MDISGVKSRLHSIFTASHNVAQGVLSSALYGMLINPEATAATVNPHVAACALAVVAVLGVGKRITRPQDRQQLAEQLKGIGQDARNAVELLEALRDGGIELEVDINELAKGDIADKVAERFESELGQLPEDVRRTLQLVEDMHPRVQRIDEGVERIERKLDNRPTSPPVNTNFHLVGRDRDPKFVALPGGRLDDLEKLHEALGQDNTVLTHALSAAGGVGKTALAIEYAIRFGREQKFYDGYWFIDASSEALEPAALALARTLEPHTPLDSPPEVVRAIIQQRLGSGRHLLILDNLDKPEDRHGFMLPSPSRLLITTRLHGDKLPGITVQDIALLSLEECVTILREGTALGEEQDDVLRQIAEHLGHLALAIRFTAAYLRRYPHIPPQEVLDKLRSAEVGSPGDPLEKIDPDTVDANYHKSVAQSLSLHFDSLSTPERSILCLAAFCHPDNIPLDLLVSLVDGADDAIATLADRHIFEREKDAASIHRLTQSVARGRLSPETTATVLGALTNAMLPTFVDEHKLELWPARDRLAPHARAVVERAAMLHSVKPAATLANDVGTHDLIRARLDAALTSFRLAERIHRKACGDDHPGVAAYVINIGSVHQAKGQLDEAMRRFREAEHNSRKAFGDDHPNVSACVNNIGGVHKVKGELDKALRCFREAERIDRKAFGDDHPNVARFTNCIGSVLHDKGELDEALRCYKEAERIDRKAFGNDHPSVAIRVNNIGRVLQDKGELDEAMRCFREVEHIFRKAFGDDHPKVAACVNNIGGVHQVKGELDEALRCFREAERIDRKTFGNDHPQVATRVSNIGDILLAKGDKAGALRCYETAFDICLRRLGPRAMNTIQGAINLASLKVNPFERALEVTGAEVAKQLYLAVMEELARRQGGDDGGGRKKQP